MKNQFKSIALLAFLVLSAISLSSNAQSLRSPGIRYSIGADGGLPVGNLSDSYKLSLGGSVQADIPIVSTKVYVTINAGYTNIFADENVSSLTPDIHLIPVKAGLKYFPVANFYLQGEAGVSFILNSDANGSKSAAFVYAPQVGYLIPLGKESNLDAGIRYEANTKFYDAAKNTGYLALRVAYAFPIGKKLKG